MDNENVVVLNSGNYKEFVTANDKLTLVDFWARWCLPCRAVAPILSDLAEKYADKIKIGKLDIDENNDIAGMHGITSIPTILVFKGGEVVETIIGARPYDDFKNVVEKYVGGV